MNIKQRCGVTAILFFFSSLSYAQTTRGATRGILTIMEDTTLAQDHNGNIVIGKSGVTLDCRSFTVRGNNSGIGITIKGSSPISAVKVLNCVVVHFETGVQLLSGTGGNSFTNNVVKLNTGTGVFLSRSSRNSFTGNRVEDNKQRGFHLEKISDENFFAFNRARNNDSEGFRVETSSFNSFIDNNVRENKRDGMDLNKSNSNTFINNDVTNNIINGIELDNCNDNILARNTVNRNGQNGISLDTSLRNVLKENIANSNLRRGFQIANFSNDNFFIGNRACRNRGPEDANRQTNYTCNAFLSNDFCKSDNIFANVFLSNRFCTTVDHISMGICTVDRIP